MGVSMRWGVTGQHEMGGSRPRGVQMWGGQGQGGFRCGGGGARPRWGSDVSLTLLQSPAGLGGGARNQFLGSSGSMFSHLSTACRSFHV